MVRIRVRGEIDAKAHVFTNYAGKRNGEMFSTWLAGLVDLKRQEIERFWEAAGGRSDRRVRRLRRLDFLNNAAAAAGFLLMYGCLITVPTPETRFPVLWKAWPFLEAAAAAAPILGLMLHTATRRALSAGRVRLTPGTTPGRLLPLAGASAGAAVFIQSVLTLRVFDWTEAASRCAVAAILALTVWALAAAPRVSPKWLFFAPCLSIWAAGLTLKANTLFDMARPREFETVVLSKTTPGGSNARRAITVAPWGPAPREMVIDERIFFYQVAPGDPLCVTFHPGALGIRWYELHLCGEPPPF